MKRKLIKHFSMEDFPWIDDIFLEEEKDKDEERQDEERPTKDNPADLASM